jgi:hypothetical protein
MQITLSRTLYRTHPAARTHKNPHVSINTIFDVVYCRVEVVDRLRLQDLLWNRVRAARISEDPTHIISLSLRRKIQTMSVCIRCQSVSTCKKGQSSGV